MHRSTGRPAQRFAYALSCLFLLCTVLIPACAGGEGDHDDSDGHHDHEPSGDPLMDYCNCMLNRCHDIYHVTWGEDHLESEAACLEAAGTLPLAGEEVTSGNYLECRQYYCSAAEVIDGAGDDADNCPQAMGEHTCIE